MGAVMAWRTAIRVMSASTLSTRALISSLPVVTNPVRESSAAEKACPNARGRLGGEAQLLQGFHADADLVGGLADRIRRADRVVHERGEATDGGHTRERAA